jgi:nitroreductase
VNDNNSFIKGKIMSRVHELIKNRHTTRLMKDDIKQEDMQTIIDSARRAPSKNKIYGYKVIALTNSEQGKQLKKVLCDDITLYEEDDSRIIYLKQTLAPLVLVYIANPAPEHQMVNVKEEHGEEVFDSCYSDVKGQADRYAMIKSSVRDAMISATYAQLTAEDLGYGTAYVACGIESLMGNRHFHETLVNEFGADYKQHPVESVVLMCIGPKHEKIINLYNGTDTERKEAYLNGETHYRRAGREESFFVNKKQEAMFTEI